MLFSFSTPCKVWFHLYNIVIFKIFLVIIGQIILDAGVDVNIRNAQNTIPLHVALARGAKSCVGLLLSAGANYNLQVYSSVFLSIYI